LRAVSARSEGGSVGLSALSTTALVWPRARISAIATNRQSPKFGCQDSISPMDDGKVDSKNAVAPGGPYAM
jgi:hypothetical protein